MRVTLSCGAYSIKQLIKSSGLLISCFNKGMKRSSGAGRLKKKDKTMSADYFLWEVCSGNFSCFRFFKASCNCYAISRSISNALSLEGGFQGGLRSSKVLRAGGTVCWSSRYLPFFCASKASCILRSASSMGTGFDIARKYFHTSSLSSFVFALQKGFRSCSGFVSGQFLKFKEGDYLPDSLRSFSAFFSNSSLGRGFAFFFNCSHKNSRSGPRNGLTKSPEALLFILPMLKGTDCGSGLQTRLSGLTQRARLSRSSLRVGICASSVTKLPVSPTVKATEIPLHISVRPVITNTGKGKVWVSSWQPECGHSITSSSSLVERIPNVCRWVMDNLLWSYSIFMGPDSKNQPEGIRLVPKGSIDDVMPTIYQLLSIPWAKIVFPEKI